MKKLTKILAALAATVLSLGANAAIPGADTSGARVVINRPTAVSDAKSMGARVVINRPTAVSDAKSVAPREGTVKTGDDRVVLDLNAPRTTLD